MNPFALNPILARQDRQKRQLYEDALGRADGLALLLERRLRGRARVVRNFPSRPAFVPYRSQPVTFVIDVLAGPRSRRLVSVKVETSRFGYELLFFSPSGQVENRFSRQDAQGAFQAVVNEVGSATLEETKT